MTKSKTTDWQLFKISEELARKTNCMQAAIFGAIFMMFGLSLDFVVYQEHLGSLFVNRVVTSILMLLFAGLCLFVTKNSVARVAGHMVAMLPIVSISYMIFDIDGAQSPYWAGLNLVIVGATLLLRWNTFDSILNVILCIACYGFAIRIHDSGDAFYDLGKKALVPGYFIFVTGTIASTATYFYTNHRFREFCLAKQVSDTNKELTATNQKLAENNSELEAANTKLKEQATLLVQSEKLSSLGRMSAGIVHEVNNPLNYSKIAIHSLRSFESSLDESEREDFMEVISDAEEGVVRVIGIITDLRAFTRGDTMHMESVQLASIAENARKLVSATLVDTDLDINIDPAHEIEGNERQLCQLLVNFIQNATRAIDVKERESGPYRGEISLRTESHDGGVSIIMRDNGCGISAEDIDRIFEPFFTKNDVGEGMGLGLSICHRILDQHNARVSVDSVVGEFTEFNIFFQH